MRTLFKHNEGVADNGYIGYSCLITKKQFLSSFFQSCCHMQLREGYVNKPLNNFKRKGFTAIKSFSKLVNRTDEKNFRRYAPIKYTNISVWRLEEKISIHETVDWPRLEDHLIGVKCIGYGMGEHMHSAPISL